MFLTVKNWIFKETSSTGGSRRFLVTKNKTTSFNNNCFIVSVTSSGAIIYNGFNPPTLPDEVVKEFLDRIVTC